MDHSCRENHPITERRWIFNPGGASQAERTVCIAAGFHDHLLTFYLDGKQKLELSMPTGSVTIEGLQVTIDGVSR